MKNRNIFLLSSSGPSELGAIAAGVIVQREAADWRLHTLPEPASRPQLARLLRAKPDGCIVHCGQHGSRFREEDFGGVPVVWMDRDPAELGPNALCVVQDSHRAGRLAAAELLRHRDLVAFAFVDRHLPSFWSAERRDAFREEVAKDGRPFFEFSASDSRTWHRRIGGFLAALPRPAGVFCATDGTAGETMQAAARLGIPMPDELAVVGVDDLELFCEQQEPTLTSVRPPFVAAGRAAVQLLAQRLANPRMGGAVATFEATEITRRQSTRRIEVRGARFGKALELIRRGAAAGVGVDDVAAALGCSRRSAEIRFRKWMGCTVLDAIHAARVDLAKRILADGMVRIGDLPSRCGFKSVATFRRVFSAVAGMSPRDYVRTLRSRPAPRGSLRPKP